MGLSARGARPLSADGRPRSARLLTRRCTAWPPTARDGTRSAGWTRFRIPEYADAAGRGAVEGQPAEGPVHRRGPPRPRRPADGRAVHRASIRSTSSCCARRSLELRDRGRTLIFSTHQMEAAEALCESVAIVDHGRLVAGGRVRDLKRASGRRTVRLAVEGELAGGLAGRRCPASSGSGRTTAGSRSNSCPAPTRRRSSAAVLGAGRRSHRFEVVEPTLEALFIEHVGRPSDDDATLVPDVAAAVALGRRGRLMARATRSCRTPGSSPGANTATGRAARCSSARPSSSRSWR